MPVLEKNNSLSQSEQYDLYAPAVYGRILSIVHKGPIAEKVLEKVFINAFTAKHAAANSLLSPLNTLLNASRDKSNKTIQALNLFKDCCEASGVCVTVKK